MLASDIGPESYTGRRQELLAMATAFQLSASLYVAAKTGVADYLTMGPCPVQQLAVLTKSNADALYRVLRVLISVHVFAEPEPKVIALTPLGELLCSSSIHSYRESVLWYANPFGLRVFSDLMYSVQTGKPAIEHLYSVPVFDLFASDPELSDIFNAGMGAISADLSPAVLEAYDFSQLGTLMDVGGGQGRFLCEALRKYPRMTGILLDLPKTAERAKLALADFGLTERCQVIVGDLFKSIPDGADCYIMQHILHDWDDECALQILANVRRALGERDKGKLIVVDCVVPQNSEPHRSKFLDLVMLTMPGGRERTEQEWSSLLSKSGFAITQIVPTKLPESVIEARLM